MSGRKSKKVSAEARGGPPPDQKTVRQAERFIADVERLLAKHAKKVEDPDKEKLQAGIANARAALADNQSKRLSIALKELDTRVDQVLGFAKKSTVREYAEQIGVAVLIAVVLRFFVFEAFKIPTGSMIPTLEVGDHIFVNKFIYGLRVPLSNQWFVEWGSPERGQVIVFQFPGDEHKTWWERHDYIKRVVAVAGDEVSVVGDRVFVNGVELKRSGGTETVYREHGPDDLPRRVTAYTEISHETGVRYQVLYNRHPHIQRWPDQRQYPGLECEPFDAQRRGHCTVQPGHVFVMGDNRDNSSDSRVWGAVPHRLVKGEAMFVWYSAYGWLSGFRWERFGQAVR